MLEIDHVRKLKQCHLLNEMQVYVREVGRQTQVRFHGHADYDLAKVQKDCSRDSPQNHAASLRVETLLTKHVSFSRQLTANY